jgi:hypothetical protein
MKVVCQTHRVGGADRMLCWTIGVVKGKWKKKEQNYMTKKITVTLFDYVNVKPAAAAAATHNGHTSASCSSSKA